MTYRQSIDGCLSSRIGDAGLREDRLTQWLTLLTPRFKALEEQAQDGSLAHFSILSAADDIEEARAAYDKLAAGADTILILGTGGASLGGQALAQLGGWSIPGDNGPDGEKRPRLRFYHNLDARSFMRGLDILDIPKTRFIVISKSGLTAATLAQTLTALKFIEDAGHAALIPHIFLGVTAPETKGVFNGLRALFAARGIPMLPHGAEIGGRYSAFTVASLLPAFARGLDVAAFRAGGREVIALAAEAGAHYLAGRSIGDVVQAEQEAIVKALGEAQRPVRVIDLPRIDERALGALMMHFIIETILAADLLSVDPFDQPAIEAAGRLTRDYLAG
jgi:glucose-6-phosphate isomerase